MRACPAVRCRGRPGDIIDGSGRRLAEIECSGRRPRLLGLGEFAAAFGQRVLPVLRLFRSPGLAASGLPVSWLGMIGCETVEWALARDDPGAAALLIRRHRQRPVRGQQTWRGRIGRDHTG